MAIGQIPATPFPYSRFELVTTTSTWTHPQGASPNKLIRIIACSGGGGGSSGSAYSQASSSTGGAGGGGGGAGFIAYTEGIYSASLSITIGAGGSGGAARGGSSNIQLDPASGSDGGDTTVSGGNIYVIATVKQYSGYDPAVGVSTGNAGSSFYGGNGSSGGGAGAYFSDVGGEGGNLGYGAREGQISSRGFGYLPFFNASTSFDWTNYNPFLAQWAPGGGGGGGNYYVVLNAAGSGGKGFYNNNGGAGGAGAFNNSNSNAVTATAGSAGTRGGGGGGGGAALQGFSTPGVATSGAGGAGGAGWVLIYY